MATLRASALRAGLLALLLIYLLSRSAAAAGTPGDRQITGSRPNHARAPGLSIEPYVRSSMARQMRRLRPAILAAAHRHNLVALSGMSDQEFAVVIATILYNENFGWLEDEIAPLRPLTPLYQDVQRQANVSRLGSNFSVWPANLRPSVALEIVRHELPLADGRVITVPVRVAGSQIRPGDYRSRGALYAALTAEISQGDLAVEYLAANLERGLYRAAIEGTPVSWRTLAAWHNQGIISPQAIRANPAASDYVRRAAAYLPAARDLLRSKLSSHGSPDEPRIGPPAPGQALSIGAAPPPHR